MIPHGPLEPLIWLFDAGCVLVICISVYASLLAIATGVRNLPWRKRRHYRGLGSLMDTGDGQGGVPPLPRDDHGDPRHWAAWTGPQPRLRYLVNPEMERYLEVRARATGNPGLPPGCRFCAPVWDASQPCQCGAIPCDDPGCGALAWQAVANTEEWNR